MAQRPHSGSFLLRVYERLYAVRGEEVLQDLRAALIGGEDDDGEVLLQIQLHVVRRGLGVPRVGGSCFAGMLVMVVRGGMGLRLNVKASAI